MNNKYKVSGFDKNCRPWTRGNDYDLITDLGDEYMSLTLGIVNSWFVPSISINKRHSSYSIKHWLEDELWVRTDGKIGYISNNQAKDAMLMAGFNTTKNCIYNINWYFNVKPTKELKEWLLKRGQRW